MIEARIMIGDSRLDNLQSNDIKESLIILLESYKRANYHICVERIEKTLNMIEQDIKEQNDE